MQKISFEAQLPIIDKEIEKRRNNWRLSSVEFDDAKQIILLRVFNKYHTFDPEKGEFTHWINRFISNAIKNIVRDNLIKWSRPCICGCVYNLGGEACGFTESGTQCAECPLFEKWQNKKQNHFNVKQTLPLENHFQEVNNLQCDFIDIEKYKEVIDKKIKLKLTVIEYKVYNLLFVKYKKIEDIGILLGYKQKTNSKLPAGYQALLKIKRKIISEAKEILQEELESNG